MTSSCGAWPPAYEAVICRCHQTVGPIRLPMQNADAFVAAFNRIYAKQGMRLEELSEQSGPLIELIVDSANKT